MDLALSLDKFKFHWFASLWNISNSWGRRQEPDLTPDHQRRRKRAIDQNNPTIRMVCWLYSSGQWFIQEKACWTILAEILVTERQKLCTTLVFWKRETRCSCQLLLIRVMNRSSIWWGEIELVHWKWFVLSEMLEKAILSGDKLKAKVILISSNPTELPQSKQLSLGSCLRKYEIFYCLWWSLLESIQATVSRNDVGYYQWFVKSCHDRLAFGRFCSCDLTTLIKSGAWSLPQIPWRNMLR